MKNENLQIEQLAEEFIAPDAVDSDGDAQKSGNLQQYFASDNWPAMVTLAVMMVLTVVGWILVWHAVERDIPGLAEKFRYAVLMGMFIFWMSVNLLIFFLMSYALQQRARLINLERSNKEQLQNQLSEIKLNEERFELALKAADDGVWDRNIERGTVYYSPRWKAMLGYADNEMTNSHDEWLRRVHPDDAALIGRHEQSHFDGKYDRFKNDYRLRHKDGDYRWVQDRGLIFVDPDGKVKRIIGVMCDVTEQKRVEKLKGEFISTVSHELRTPLTSIAASLGLLEAGVFGELPSKALGLVNIASKNSKRLTTLVNDILDMEKLLSGKTPFRTDEIDLTEVIKLSLELNFDIINSFGVNVVILSPPGGRHVIGDRDRLLQVMGNLMSNAAKFSTYGGEVEIHIIQEDHFTRVEIRDHGIGISDEFRSRVFGEFAQADISDTRQHGGIGLGLNITKKLVERMGGEIGFESELGKGSTFWFTLPSSASWNFNTN